jgi:hypothetical protein
VAALAVVKYLDVVEHIRSGFFAISVTYTIDTFTFENAKEALNNRVIVAVASATHAALDTLFIKLLTEVVARVLAASITMVDESTLWLSSTYSHGERVNHQVSVYPTTHRPANDLS